MLPIKRGAVTNIAKAVSQRQNENAQDNGYKTATIADTQAILKRSNGIPMIVVASLFCSRVR